MHVILQPGIRALDAGEITFEASWLLAPTCQVPFKNRQVLRLDPLGRDAAEGRQRLRGHRGKGGRGRHMNFLTLLST